MRGFLHLPAAASGDALVLAHSASADCNAPLLVEVAEAFAARGWTVLRCDLAFRQTRPHGPPPRGSSERDQQGLRRAVEAMKLLVTSRVFLGGHSYGGRQATMLAAAQPGLAEALLLLSYPLHPPRRPTELRTAHFPSLRTPALFVHGTRDGFGSIEEMTAALGLIPARTQLVPIAGAGHSLITTRNRGELPQAVAAAFGDFINAE